MKFPHKYYHAVVDQQKICGHRHINFIEASKCAKELGGQPAFFDGHNSYTGSKGYYLNEYLINRSFGGREEGNWWYDSGVFVMEHGCNESIDLLQDQMYYMRNFLDKKRVYQYEPGSVLCKGYSVLYIEPHPGKDFPEETPHYE